MIASLRFNGLEVTEDVLRLSQQPSPPSLDNAWFTGAVISTVNMLFSRVDFSKLARALGLRALAVFSWPLPGLREYDGGVLPLPGVWLRARLIGLLGEVRVRDDARTGAVFDRVADPRRDSFALGGKGTANGDGV